MQLTEALEIAKKECKNPYAQEYLKNIYLSERLYGGEGKKTNIRYALSNMSGWRGETAKQVKNVIREYLKENSND